jgi:parallel beta-helix repeat protein
LSAGTIFFSSDASTATLTFSGTPTAYDDAVLLNGDGAGLEGMGITTTAGDYQRGVEMRGDRTFVRYCKINMSSPDATSEIGITPQVGSQIYDLDISYNDITGDEKFWFGILASYVTGLRIVGNYIHDVNSSETLANRKLSWGIYASTDTSGVLIQGNTIVDCNIGGIQFGGSDVAASMILQSGRQIIGNHIRSVLFGVGVYYSTGAIISDNYISDGAMLITTVDCDGIRITGNVFDTLSSDASGDYVMVSIGANCTGVTVANNYFGAAGTSLFCIYCDSADPVISNNTFNNTARCCVRVSSSSARPIINGNTCYPATGGSDDCIRNSAGNAVISGNICRATSGQASIHHDGDDSIISGNRCIGGADGIQLPSGADNNLILGNVITGVSGTEVSDSGSGNTKEHNI